MNTKSTYRIFSLVMAFLILVSTVGISADMHICQDRIRSVSLFGDTKSCYELAGYENKKECPHSLQKKDQNRCNTALQKKACCHNASKLFQADQQPLTHAPEDIQAVNNYTLPASSPTLLCVELNFDWSTSSAPHYMPPLIVRDFSRLYQLYLL